MADYKTRNCPYCAETIKAQALVCRFCGYDLRTGKPARVPETQGKQKVVHAKSGVADGVKLGCGMFIVLPILILFGGFYLLAFLAALGGGR